MIIKTKTKYTEERIKRFLKYYYFDKIKLPRLILNILILVIIVNFFTKDKRIVTDYISFAFALIGVLELNTSFLPSFNFMKIKKKKDSILNTEISYELKKNNFKLINDKEEYIDYKSLKRVIETDYDYYLFIDNVKSLILGKDNLSENEITELTKRFKDNVEKYGYKKNIR